MLFLEGTGSLILDRKNRKAYCTISPRASKEILLKFYSDFDYTPIVFHANQSVKGARRAIYHTNVMMCIAETFTVICLDSIDDETQRKQILNSLLSDKKEVIKITGNQVENFAGNLLQVSVTTKSGFWS